MLLAFPWGNSAAAACAVPSSHCAGADVADVGTNTIDRTGLGITDMGGNLPEWVEDDYTPAPGCADLTPIPTYCATNSSCVPLLCPNATDCIIGCADGVNANFADVYCVKPPDGMVENDPFFRTRTPQPMFKGGGSSLDACLQEAGMRNAFQYSAHPVVGFRCAFGAAPTPTPTERLWLHPPADCMEIHLAPGTGTHAPLTMTEQAALQGAVLDSGGRALPFAPDANGELVAACPPAGSKALAVITGAPSRDFDLAIKYVGTGGTCTVQAGVALAAGEVPAGGADETGTCP
jgi:hypothetical protein